MSALREERPLGVALDSRSAMGRTRELIACPFCKASVWTFVWSRAGSGKRCECGAVLYRTKALAPEQKPRRQNRRRRT